MKKLFLSITAILFFQFCVAQDTIIKNNGDQIRAKVTDVNSSEIKYKKFDFLDGPNYTIKKSEVNTIRYSNGVRDHFEVQEREHDAYVSPPQQQAYVSVPQPEDNQIVIRGPYYKYHHGLIKEPEVHDILLQTKDRKIMEYVAKSKKDKGAQYIGFAAFPLAALAGYFVYQGYTNTTTRVGNGYGDGSSEFTGAGICAGLAICCPIVSGVFHHMRVANTKAAIKLYNEKY